MNCLTVRLHESLNIYFIYTLYKVKIDVFSMNKMLYGILIFIVEIHSVSLYNTYRERLLEKQWLL